MYGKSAQRQWRVDNWNGVCDDCLARRREEAREAAIKEAAEMGLPDLTGTDKQIKWAVTIRDRLVKSIEETLQKKSSEYRPEAYDYLCGITESSFWIDHRDTSADYLLKAAEKHIPAAEVAVDEETQDEAKIEATVRPDTPLTETVAEIRIIADHIEVKFPEKREDFWRIIKRGSGFSWHDTHWQRTITKFSGPIEHRAAEIGRKLLAANFVIRIYDEKIRVMAVSGDYQPEITRWIKKELNGGKFRICWGRDEDYYQAAKRIAGSRYEKPYITVPPEHYEEVLDFSQMHDFTLSDGAKELIEITKTEKEAMLTVSVDMPKTEKHDPNAKPVLSVPETVEIPDDLKD
jgi:hypothetical protein